jgi:hypothetical protein
VIYIPIYLQYQRYCCGTKCCCERCGKPRLLHVLYSLALQSGAFSSHRCISTGHSVYSTMRRIGRGIEASISSAFRLLLHCCFPPDRNLAGLVAVTGGESISRRLVPLLLPWTGGRWHSLLTVAACAACTVGASVLYRAIISFKLHILCPKFTHHKIPKLERWVVDCT